MADDATIEARLLLLEQKMAAQENALHLQQQDTTGLIKRMDQTEARQELTDQQMEAYLFNHLAHHFSRATLVDAIVRGVAGYFSLSFTALLGHSHVGGNGRPRTHLINTEGGRLEIAHKWLLVFLRAARPLISRSVIQEAVPIATHHRFINAGIQLEALRSDPTHPDHAEWMALIATILDEGRARRIDLNVYEVALQPSLRDMFGRLDQETLDAD